MADGHIYSLTLCTLKVVGRGRRGFVGFVMSAGVESGDLEVVFSFMSHFRISFMLHSGSTKVRVLACEIIRAVLGRTSPLHKGEAKICSES